jgi:hypothetical protein
MPDKLFESSSYSSGVGFCGREDKYPNCITRYFLIRQITYVHKEVQREAKCYVKGLSAFLESFDNLGVVSIPRTELSLVSSQFVNLISSREMQV